MAQALAGSAARGAGTRRPGRREDRADRLMARLGADVQEAERHGVISAGESAELLARLAIVVDQAVGH